MIVIEGKENVWKARMLTLRQALKLEIIGLKHRGGSVYALIKREFGLKGNKQKVYEEFTLLCEKVTGIELKR